MSNPTTYIKLPHGEPFAEKWNEWIKYRKEIKKPLKSAIAISRCLNQLDIVTEKEAIEMIDTSIRNQYQGIFPLKKNPFEKEETPQVLSKPKEQRLSTYEPKEYDPEKGKDFIIGKIKQAYETGILLNDVGDVFTRRLKPFLSTPESVLIQIDIDVLEIVMRKPKNRFEEKVEINEKLEIRNRVLKYNIDRWREQGRDISLEI